MTRERLSDIHLQMAYWRYRQLREQGFTGDVAQRALAETAPHAVRAYHGVPPRQPPPPRRPLSRWLRRWLHRYH